MARRAAKARPKIDGGGRDGATILAPLAVALAVLAATALAALWLSLSYDPGEDAGAAATQAIVLTLDPRPEPTPVRTSPPADKAPEPEIAPVPRSGSVDKAPPPPPLPAAPVGEPSRTESRLDAPPGNDDLPNDAPDAAPEADRSEETLDRTADAAPVGDAAHELEVSTPEPSDAMAAPIRPERRSDPVQADEQAPPVVPEKLDRETPQAPPRARDEANDPRPLLPPAGLERPSAPSETRVALAPTLDPFPRSDPPRGSLPLIGPDGRRTWQVFRRPFDEGDQRPRIALVFAGLGQSRSATETSIEKLPGEVTLGFDADAADLNDWIARARRAGHEVILLLPLPGGYRSADPRGGATPGAPSRTDELVRLESLLDRVTGYVGVTNYADVGLSESEARLRPVLTMVKERGLLYLDSRASRHSLAPRVARDIELPLTLNNRFVDRIVARNSIDAQLDELEYIARETGHAVGMAYPYPVVIERVAAWANALGARGIALAPLTALVGRQQGR